MAPRGLVGRAPGPAVARFGEKGSSISVLYPKLWSKGQSQDVPRHYSFNFVRVAEAERLLICDDIQLGQPKTAKMADALGGLGVSGRTLLVTAEYDANVALGAKSF